MKTICNQCRGFGSIFSTDNEMYNCPECKGSKYLEADSESTFINYVELGMAIKNVIDETGVLYIRVDEKMIGFSTIEDFLSWYNENNLKGNVTYE